MMAYAEGRMMPEHFTDDGTDDGFDPGPDPEDDIAWDEQR
jgi:hypothetical protein